MRIRRTRHGEIAVHLAAEEQLLLRRVAASTLALLRDGDDASLRRLFPPGYDDAELEREYRELTRGELTGRREQELELLEATVGRDVLTPAEADAWLRALNDVRLVLGTRLDVTEELDWNALDPGDPRLPELAVYGYVSWLQEQLVDAVS